MVIKNGTKLNVIIKLKRRRILETIEIMKNEKMPIMICPGCGAEYEDFDGFGVLYCEKCGYCVHASISDGHCDYCGIKEELIKRG